MNIYIKKTMKCQNSKITHDIQYKGIYLLSEHRKNGFYKYKLDIILKYFKYIDILKNIDLKFIRFHFDKTWKKNDVQEFFKQTKKWHSDNNKFFTYLCSMEEDEFGNNHFHAFCILNSEDYRTRKNVINMLYQRSEFLLKKNTNLNQISVNTKKAKNTKYNNFKTYNYYSISNNSKYDERRQALTEASYLAKFENTPSSSKVKRERTIFGSEIPDIARDHLKNAFYENFEYSSSISLCTSQSHSTLATRFQNSK